MTAAALALLFVSAQAAAADPTLLVLPLGAKAGVPADMVDALNEHLVAQARRIPGVKVTALADVQQLIGAEMRQQMLGCSETSCLADIGGALNAGEILYGSVGRLGASELVLSLTRVDPRTASPVAGESERLTTTDTDGMLDGLCAALARLFPAYTAPPARSLGVRAIPLTLAMAGTGAVVQFAATASFAFAAGAMLYAMPLAPCVFPPLCLGWVLSPLASTWAQALMADMMGRRQVGIRKAALLGVLLAGPVWCSAVLPTLCGALCASQFGGNYFFVTVTRPALRLVGQFNDPIAQDNAKVFSYGLATLLGAGCGIMPALLLSTTLVPLFQAAWLLVEAHRRARHEEPRIPGLFGPTEDPPSFLSRLPRALLGGMNASDLPDPAAPPAVRAARPSNAGGTTNDAPKPLEPE